MLLTGSRDGLSTEQKGQKNRPFSRISCSVQEIYLSSSGEKIDAKTSG